jgi:hypothetical protein
VIPPAVLDALQEHIDRTTSDLLRQYKDNTDACNAIQQGKNLGKLQEWIFAQKRSESAIVPDIHIP